MPNINECGVKVLYPLDVQCNVVNPTTPTSSDGSATLIISGGTPPYTYTIGSQFSYESFQTPLSAYTFDNLSSGAYSLTLTESTPGVICRQTSNFDIVTSNNVDFLISGTDANNGNDGTVSASITNGTPPFTLLWSNNVNGQTGYYLSNLSAGTYSLQVTDDDGCVKVREVTIDGFDSISSFQTFNICDDDIIDGFGITFDISQTFDTFIATDINFGADAESVEFTKS